jgi:hypothetical protein
VYRQADAIAVCSAAVERFGANAIANPNKLEAYGDRICTQAQANLDKMLKEGATITTSNPPSSSSSSDGNNPHPPPASSSSSLKAAASASPPIPESPHRNHLESLLRRSTLMACPEEACVAVVTVNVVQRTYKVRTTAVLLYESTKYALAHRLVSVKM